MKRSSSEQKLESDKSNTYLFTNCQCGAVVADETYEESYWTSCCAECKLVSYAWTSGQSERDVLASRQHMQMVSLGYAAYIESKGLTL